MKKYILKADDQEITKEALDLFQQLGYELVESDRSGMIYAKDGKVLSDRLEFWNYYRDQENCAELTLPQLRDLVVLKRNDVKDATHEDSEDGLKCIDLMGKWYWFNDEVTDEFPKLGWQKSASTREYDDRYLKLISPTQDPALISGADALRALADGKEVEFQQNENWYSLIYSNVHVKCVLNDSYKLRLKPQTFKLELELPKPFEPKVGEKYYLINPFQEDGYDSYVFDVDNCDHIYTQFGAYRTEEEIKQVVEQLRKMRGAS